jgi:hypothetical protein
VNTRNAPYADGGSSTGKSTSRDARQRFARDTPAEVPRRPPVGRSRRHTTWPRIPPAGPRHRHAPLEDRAGAGRRRVGSRSKGRLSLGHGARDLAPACPGGMRRQGAGDRRVPSLGGLRPRSGQRAAGAARGPGLGGGRRRRVAPHRAGSPCPGGTASSRRRHDRRAPGDLATAHPGGPRRPHHAVRAVRTRRSGDAVERLRRGTSVAGDGTAGCPAATSRRSGAPGGTCALDRRRASVGAIGECAGGASPAHPPRGRHPGAEVPARGGRSRRRSLPP